MSNAQLGRTIRIRLDDNYLTNVWLIEQLRKGGTIIDAARLSKILRGSIQGALSGRILEESKKILDRYEFYFKD